MAFIFPADADRTAGKAFIGCPLALDRGSTVVNSIALSEVVLGAVALSEVAMSALKSWRRLTLAARA